MRLFEHQNPRDARARKTAAMPAPAGFQPSAAWRGGQGARAKGSALAGRCRAVLAHGGHDRVWSLGGFGDVTNITLERGSPAPREAERNTGHRP